MAHTPQTNQFQNEQLVLEDVDIEIGAVEIKDGVTDLRATVQTVAGGNALLVDFVASGGPISIIGNAQTFVLETASALGASGSFTTPSRDMSNFESLGVSVHFARDASDANVTIIVEHAVSSSFPAASTHPVFSQSFNLTAANPDVDFNQVFAATREFMRVRLVNNTAVALLETDLVTTRKPIS